MFICSGLDIATRELPNVILLARRTYVLYLDLAWFSQLLL